MPDVAIIGAGAAGLMAAIHAATPGKHVQLLERTADGGRKILISGGGRCNVLPSQLLEKQYVTSSSPNTMKKLLRSWPLPEQRAFFEQTLGLPLVLEPETGKLFPVANKARAVREALRDTAVARGVEWLSGTTVTRIDPVDSHWQIHRDHAPALQARTVIVTTGGLSVPLTGSDGFGLRELARLGHTVRPTYPALTPLTQNPAEFADLAGISLHVRLTAHGDERREAVGGFLFTHRGYSGPTVLDVAHVAIHRANIGAPAATLKVRWLDIPNDEWERRLAPSVQSVSGAIRHTLPARLADRIIAMSGVAPGTVLAQLPRAGRLKLFELLSAFPLPWNGDEGYKKAEVTGGGVALEEVDSRTMESRMQRGLFIAGEVLDAFGPIGGYNFVWAWTTGRLAGLGAAAHPLP